MDFGISQKQWRRMGALSLLASAAMAVYAAWSGFLRLTVLHVAALASEEAAAQLPADSSGWLHLAYWLLFLLLILFTLYLALIDLQYIRLQYLRQKRDIFLGTLGEREFREGLRKPPSKERNEQT